MSWRIFAAVASSSSLAMTVSVSPAAAQPGSSDARVVAPETYG